MRIDRSEKGSSDFGKQSQNSNKNEQVARRDLIEWDKRILYVSCIGNWWQIKILIMYYAFRFTNEFFLETTFFKIVSCKPRDRFRTHFNILRTFIASTALQIFVIVLVVFAVEQAEQIGKYENI